MEKKWTCTKCGKLNEADVRRCYSCGHFIEYSINQMAEAQRIVKMTNRSRPAEEPFRQSTGKTFESSKEEFRRQYEEALGYEKLPFLTGTTRVAMQWIIGCALFVFFWFVADQLIFRESFSRSTLGAEIILFLSTMASYSIVKALFGGLG